MYEWFIGLNTGYQSLISTVVANAVVELIGLIFKGIIKFSPLRILWRITKKVSIHLYDFLCYRLLPYRIINLDKVKDYIFVQALHDGLILESDPVTALNTRIGCLKKGDICRIPYSYYKRSIHMKDNFKLLKNSEVIHVRYTENYLNKCIDDKCNEERRSSPSVRSALFVNMDRDFYILKSNFDSIKYRIIV